MSKKHFLTFDHNYTKYWPIFKIFDWQISKLTLYQLLQGLPPHLNRVAARPWKNKKIK